jgi:uncharacterized protein (TIGR01777 family)
MTTVLAILTIQCLVGAFDNLWHHEFTADLTHRPGARSELMLHTAREFLYAILFIGIAWWRWQGGWAIVLMALLGVEIVVTAADFVIEDRTRRLPALERVLHTGLAINFGVVLAVWAPELRLWLAAPTGLAPVDYGIWSRLMIVFAAGVLAWAVRDLYAVIRLAVPQWQRQPLRAGSAALPRHVLITGATGFVGRALTRALIERGDHVIALSRDPAKARDLFGPLVDVCGGLDELDSHRRIDAIVNLAGEALAGGFWTKARKRRFVDSRVSVTGAVVALIARLADKPEVLISGSAIGYYGSRGDELLTETSGTSSDFTADLCQRWEAAALEAARWDVRICRLRIGVVLGGDGGILPTLARATRYCAGTVLGTGRQFVAWIHRDDLVRLILFALDRRELMGPINAVAPEPIRQADLMRNLGTVLRRPIFAAAPPWLLRLALGAFSEIVLASQRVMPDRAVAAGFHFAYGAVAAALRDLLAPSPAPSEPLRVFVNERCPVCRVEMRHYRDLGTVGQQKVEYVSIDCLAQGLARYGLAEADLRYRLYVEVNGEMYSGVDAALALWRVLPGYRHFVPLIRQPGFRQLAVLLYEGLAVPILWLWGRRRAALKGVVA